MTADWYDVINAWDASDDFYLDLVLAAGSVLDVGCGTGALLGRARESGHTGRLVGLDPDAEALAVARARHDVEWVLGDAASAPWEREFDLAVMTGHAFQALITDGEVREALAAIRAALVPGGRFAFETRNPAARAWERWTPENGKEVTDSDGVTVRVEHDAELVGDVVRLSETFSGPPWPEPQVSWGSLRFLAAERLDGFLAEAGLVVEDRFGDWGRGPVTAGSPELITVARRA
jgi:SAM-dependent methyltransferase